MHFPFIGDVCPVYLSADIAMPLMKHFCLVCGREGAVVCVALEECNKIDNMDRKLLRHLHLESVLIQRAASNPLSENLLLTHDIQGYS